MKLQINRSTILWAILAIDMGCLTVWSIAHAQSIKPIENVAYKTNQSSNLLPSTSLLLPKVPSNSTHPIRAVRQISEDSLRGFLELRRSPLAPLSGQLLQSPYYSLIIAITNAEESFYKNPYNNLYGLMGKSGLIHFASVGDGLTAIETFLAKAESNGRDTIESFRHWYCYEASTPDHTCWSWEKTVLETKAQVENL